MRKTIMSKLSRWLGCRKQYPEYDVQAEWQYWKSHVGKFSPPDANKRFVLIKQPPKTVLFFDTFNEATEEGYRRFHSEPFMVQPIEDRPIEIARCSQPEWAQLPD